MIELNTDEDHVILDAINGEDESEWFKKAGLYYIQSGSGRRPSEDIHCSTKQVVSFLELRCPQLSNLSCSDEEKIRYIIQAITKNEQSNKNEIRASLIALDTLPQEGCLW
ncbi:hypothetical protein WJ0W_007123 [Paenibacillus melissococcoides]|uniref:Uncharacterized protein n=1 Tax=Paenibacillus melissococcoides TaxID=2912268 RepID=A0ABN8UF74_9BACL|nr:hypothetical protein [Paenibacillus melissococcoides]CAH8248455.1 hypothetical protein WJ0W_007123 [Paenibacillus melissococcoides]CAH8722049.1 hypothetical protein HTL2_006667 [Paenibacillus melissococcoides]CAH8722153.1 hypothetical protein WDD9_006656 [Paenibacillus melissococcoides]